MRLKPIDSILITLMLCASALTGCGTNSQSNEIDPSTGMPKLFCGAIKPDFKKAYNDFWSLTKGTKINQAIESLNKLAQDTGDSAGLATGSSKEWLSSVNSNAIGLINFLGGASDSTTGQSLAAAFNAEFSQLSTYC